MDKNVFQKIIDREIPATIEYEDDRVIAIRDIAPSAAVHVLVIPKTHLPSAAHLTEEHAPLVGHIMVVANQLATQLGIAERGYRIVTNVNADAGQTVFHLHFHVLGGEPLGRMNGGTAPSGGTRRAGVVREAGMIVLFALGLAVTYNLMSPKPLAWIKPTYVSTAVDDTAINAVLKNTATPASPTAPTNVAPQPIASQPATPPTTKAEPVKAEPVKVEQTATSTSKTVNLAQFKKLIASPSTLLVDARMQDKYDVAHIGNAINIFGAEVEQHVPDILNLNLPMDKVIVVYCDGGHCELSHRVANVFMTLGYKNVFVYTGGWEEWSTKK